MVLLIVVGFLGYVALAQRKSKKEPVKYRRAGGSARTAKKTASRGAMTAAAQNCPAMTPNQIFRYIVGIDPCPIAMSPTEISSELSDLYSTSVLRKNAGGAGLWPASVSDVISAVKQANTSLGQLNYLVGEGGQIPPSITKLGNQDLRYLISWGASGQTPSIYLSAAPAGIPGGTPPPFLQVIGYDTKKKGFNYFQYVSNADLGTGTDTTRTWSWAGDSSYARNPQTVGQGCFACHLNGSLNMKELTVPWNNWNSPAATINAANVPQGLASDPIYQTLTGADKLQLNFQSASFVYTSSWVSSNISGNNVSNVSELLRRLLVTTTVNFQSAQVTSASNGDINVPLDFFLNNSVFRGNSQMNFNGLGLSYTPPTTTLKRADYNNFVTAHKFALVNTANNNGAPDYSKPGDTYFSFFVPAPAYEDLVAIKQLISQGVITQQFAVAALMVDFQNPVFSPARGSLMKYAEQITSGQKNGDIPAQFATLVANAVQGQPACDPTQPSAQCSAEQQFLYYWNQGAKVQTVAQAQLQNYLAKVGNRMSTTAGANDYMTLYISREIQFSNYPLVCNLHEFDLLLPCTDLGNVFVQMNADGTISPQAAYACPPPAGWQSPCASSAFTKFASKRR